MILLQSLETVRPAPKLLWGSHTVIHITRCQSESPRAWPYDAHGLWVSLWYILRAGHRDNWDASLLNSHLNCSYSWGISTFFFPSPAWMVSSIAIPQIVLCYLSFCTMASFSSCVWDPVMSVWDSMGCMDDMTIGRALVLITTCFHPVLGWRWWAMGISTGCLCALCLWQGITWFCPLL